MNAIISSIPVFTKKIRKQKAASTLLKLRAIKNKIESAKNRASAEVFGWDKRSKLKNQIIELREMRVAYKDIAELTGASIGYVRNLCWELGMSNYELRNK